jgi:hypothetical protein
VFLLAVELYKTYLKEIEAKDVKSLASTLATMKKMKADLERDLENEAEKEQGLLQLKEENENKVHP